MERSVGASDILLLHILRVLEVNTKLGMDSSGRGMPRHFLRPIVGKPFLDTAHSESPFFFLGRAANCSLLCCAGKLIAVNEFSRWPAL